MVMFLVLVILLHEWKQYLSVSYHWLSYAYRLCAVSEMVHKVESDNRECLVQERVLILNFLHV
jgi:hypothetical protein